MREVKSLDDFRDLKNRGIGYILVTDSTGNTVHEVSCGFVTERNFTIKVLENECKQGNYFLVDDLEGALEEYNADKCSRLRAQGPFTQMAFVTAAARAPAAPTGPDAPDGNLANTSNVIRHSRDIL